MKKNLFLRMAALLLMATVATCGVFFGTGTTAKYVAAATLDASARVATFEVQVKMPAAVDGKLGGWTTFSKSDPSSAFELSSLGVLSEDLFELDAAGIKMVSGVPEAEIANHVNAHDASIIAPGTGGRFRLEFKNTSEVAVRIFFDSLTSEVVYTNGPATLGEGDAAVANPSISTALIEYSTDNENWETELKDVLDSDSVVLAPKTESVWSANDKQTIYWRWIFENGDVDETTGLAPNDIADTKLGVAAANSSTNKLSLKIGVRAVQVD